MRLAFLVLLSCSGQEHEQVPATPEPKPIVKTFQPPTIPKDAEADLKSRETVGVSLAFSNISSIHRGFFVQPKAVTNLGSALATCLEADATVEIGYTSKTLKGRIALVSNGEFGACAPIWSEHGVNLEPWIPIGQALAKYRDYVAGTSDFRISNFEVGIRIERENTSCFCPYKDNIRPTAVSGRGAQRSMASPSALRPKDPRQRYDQVKYRITMDCVLAFSVNLSGLSNFSRH